MNEQSGAAQRRDESADSAQQLTGEQRGEARRGGGGGEGGRNRHRRQQQQRSSQSQPKASLNMIELREIAELINHHGFTDFEFENENIRVRLRKELQPQIIQAQNFTPQTTPILTAPASTVQSSGSSLTSTASTSSTTTAVSVDEDANVQKIVSPIVGTFYRSPSPGAEAFVEIGSRVAPETIVCIVEAMKLMNEIPSEISGEIVKVYVENGQPVEYGQPLFAVK